MTLSYSGIVNYGKTTLPSVESWGTNMNILRDPPKSVHTRKIDKVGQTSAITSAIDESSDRTSEAINYYARGQNPMVSVSYGQGQQKSSNISGSDSYLPYRIIRDGAFRPPIFRQEDLLPISRMPRIWTNVSTQPYLPIFTMRINNCGTSENTREVKEHILKTSCMTSKTLAVYPNTNQPDMKPGIIKNITASNVQAAMSSELNNSEYLQKINADPILLRPSRPITNGYTNPHMIKEIPMVMNNITLSNNRPIANGHTNPHMIKEIPMVMNNITLSNNRPIANVLTNFSAPSLSGASGSQEYTRLAERASRGGFVGCKSIPSVKMNYPSKILKMR